MIHTIKSPFHDRIEVESLINNQQAPVALTVAGHTVLLERWEAEDLRRAIGLALEESMTIPTSLTATQLGYCR